MTSSYGSTSTIEWFGTTTFRVRQSGLDLFFDGYLDRLPGLDPVGLSAGEVGRADFVFVSHAHFDHLYGVAPIARSTGATVVASPESARVLRQDGIPEGQILMVTGGETVSCGPAASVRVLPALHSCLFAASDLDSAAECRGDLGISAQDRWSKAHGIFTSGFPWAACATDSPERSRAAWPSPWPIRGSRAYALPWPRTEIAAALDRHDLLARLISRIEDFTPAGGGATG